MASQVTNEEIFDLLQTSITISGEQFNKIDERLDGIDERLDGIDERLDGIDERLDGIDERLDNMEVDIQMIKNTQTFQQQDINELKEIVKELSGKQHAQLNDISDILDRIAEITKQPTITLSEKNELEHKLNVITLDLRKIPTSSDMPPTCTASFSVINDAVASLPPDKTNITSSLTLPEEDENLHKSSIAWAKKASRIYGVPIKI